ncbi:MAG TPA: Trm112 family protein [Actinotalea sp.]|nr:Trm112 family protein [Actinotalea sp.]
MTGLPAWARELLRCPACHGELVDGVHGASLRCSECAAVYPVRDGVPVLLVDAAAED